LKDIYIAYIISKRQASTQQNLRFCDDVWKLSHALISRCLLWVDVAEMRN